MSAVCPPFTGITIYSYLFICRKRKRRILFGQSQTECMPCHQDFLARRKCAKSGDEVKHQLEGNEKLIQVTAQIFGR